MPEKKQQTNPESVEEALRMLAWMPGFDKVAAEPKMFRVFARAIACFVDDQEFDHHEFGRVVPLDWLIDYVTRTSVFFPKPIELRAIYEQHFPPLDGLSVAELTKDIE